MPMTDAQLERAWGARCRGGETVSIRLYGAGVVTVNRLMLEAVLALSAVLKHYGYKSRAEDTGAYNCRQKTGGNGWSLHSWAIALDINWKTNPYGRRLATDYPPAMRAALKAIRTRNGQQVFTWGGDWSGNKDAMHWQAGCGPRDMATGINWGTVAGFSPSTPQPPVTPPPYTPPAGKPSADNIPTDDIIPTFEEDPMLIRNNQTGEVWMLWSDGTRRGVPNPEYAGVLADLDGQPRNYDNQRAWDIIMDFWKPVP